MVEKFKGSQKALTIETDDNDTAEEGEVSGA
jgi:hypothetical protein